MLEPAIKYKEVLENIQYNTWFNDKYKYWISDVCCSSLKIQDHTWEKHQFVSVVNGKIIGYIGYNISRADNSVSGINILNFTDNRIAFGKDLHQALRDIFERFNFRKANFSVVIGNPIEKSYDKLIAKYGGRIVGTYKEDVKLFDGKLYDRKVCEVLNKEYFNSVSKKKRGIK